jgi:hypothetical protein
MPLRIVGAASIILGIGIVLLGMNQMGMAKEIAAALTSDGRAWNLPVSQEVFFARSSLWGDAVIFAGVLTVTGAVGMVFRSRWGLYVAAAAALVMLVFPLMSQLVLAKSYAFDWSLVDLGIAAVIGLSASLAWMFRPRLGTF